MASKCEIPLNYDNTVNTVNTFNNLDFNFEFKPLNIKSFKDIIDKTNFDPELEALDKYVQEVKTYSPNAYENYRNRYSNVFVTNEHRVILPFVDNDRGSSFVNASYIKGILANTKKYIVASAPVKDYFCDWWRMVWENNVSLIVMLTRLREDETVKANQYWPEYDDCTKSAYAQYVYTLTPEIVNKADLTDSDGSFSGSLDRSRELDKSLDKSTDSLRSSGETELSSHILMVKRYNILEKENELAKLELNEKELSLIEIFELTLKENGKKTSKKVAFMWNQELLDHNVPNFTDFPKYLQCIKLYNRVYNLMNQCERNYVLVHCSAGVGRSACFVAIDMIMDNLEPKYIKTISSTIETNNKKSNNVMWPAISIFNVVKALKKRRPGMICTCHQYIFLYKFISFMLSEI